MADEVLATEKPKKAKRMKPKSAKIREEAIPLADMADDKSKSKFDQLLQQAVGQSIGAAKAEKKKKKKTDESVLESLRKGEGLQKEKDSSVIANTYDPDSPKYEKSNMKKQKLREERLQQNDVEIVDETQGKIKKKKKPKLKDEKIENLDISELAEKDKTMTMSELETSVQKTPMKKKKKKGDEEPSVSARSEDDLTPKVSTPVKKKKKQTAVDEEDQIMSERSVETAATPTKKKKKKMTAEEIQDSFRTEDEVGTPTKKKKKKPVVEEPESSRTEGETTPKKKKKKKPTGETDDEALSPTEEPLVSEDKKKKKKKGKKTDTEDEAGLSPSEEPKSPKGKKKKKKKGEETEEEEAKSPDEEESASPKGKKKKKKKKEGEEEEQEAEEDKEAPKPKERKKKKKKKGEEKEEETAEEQPGRDVDDHGLVMGVTIHRTDKLKNDFYILHPMIRVHIVNEDTGKYLLKQHKDRAVTTYYEMQNEKVTSILPIMTKPFDFKQQKSVLPVWEELLLFNENYNYFVQEKPKVIIFFELLDFVSMTRTSQNDGHDKGWHRIAWAFLKVVGNNQKINTGSKVRLQLFEMPTGIRRNPELVEPFQWWQSGSRKPYSSTLYVTLKGIRPPDVVEPSNRSLFATQEERGRITYKDMKKSINWDGKPEAVRETMSSWSRLAGQLCRLPNSLMLALPTAKKGCFTLKFSNDGRSLACACQGKEGHPILVYGIPSGGLKGKFTGHFGIVYDLCWSNLNTHLLTASSDGTARIWDMQSFGDTSEKLLPHPSFVYCAQFHPRVDSIVVTGGFDQVIRVWDVSGDESHGDLRQELEDHVGFVNSICFDDDGQKMYSADSVGVIIIWNSFYTEQPSRRGVARDWTIFKKIEDPEIKDTAINMIKLHPSGRRLLVHCRDNILRMFDLRIQRVMQKYIGALNFREQIKSSISPCGSFVFSGSEDNFAYAWNTDTGDQVIMYSELNYQNPVTDVHYHPRDHMLAFCSLGENHPVLIYSYDVQIAQMDAGLSPRHVSPTPADNETLGSARLQDELSKGGVLTKEEFQIHTTARYDKVMRTLNKVTAQMGTTPVLDLPGMPTLSPRHTGMMSMSSGYDMYGLSTPRSLMASPQAFSPHAKPSMVSTMQQQQFVSQNLYMKGADSWRPTFSEVGRQGTSRSTSPVLGRAPTLNLTAAHGKAQFNFQAPPGKAVPKYDKVVVLYDYRAQRSDELNLFTGDMVSILYKDNDNWWMGELPDGQQGFFPANYVAQEDSLMDSHRKNMTSPDAEDTPKKTVTAVKTRTGELKFLSGEEESDEDFLESTRTRRRKNRASQDNLSDNTLESSLSKKPPRNNGHRVRINEPSESNA